MKATISILLFFCATGCLSPRAERQVRALRTGQPIIRYAPLPKENQVFVKTAPASDVDLAHALEEFSPVKQ